MISRHRRQQNPATCPASIAIPSPPRRRRNPQNPWIMPWILQREERGYYRTLLGELITTDIPGYRNFTRMEPTFFYLIEERITPPSHEVNHQLQEATGSWIETGSYFETFTGETYTSLQYHCRVGRTTICKFIPQVCKAILKEFQQKYLMCPTDH